MEYRFAHWVRNTFVVWFSIFAYRKTAHCGAWFSLEILGINNWPLVWVFWDETGDYCLRLCNWDIVNHRNNNENLIK